MCVRDVVDGFGWNLRSLATVLPYHVVNEINSISIFVCMMIFGIKKCLRDASFSMQYAMHMKKVSKNDKDAWMMGPK